MSTQSIVEDRPKIVEIQCQRKICTTSFIDGRNEVLSGDEAMLRRWRVDDGSEVGEPLQAVSEIWATALSPDGKWMACGLGARPYVVLWDTENHEWKGLSDVASHSGAVASVDVSPDSTKFATGGQDKLVFIWTLGPTPGRRLVGPLRHDLALISVRFSGALNRLATATAQSIRIFNAENGQSLLTISCSFRPWRASPLAWSNDGRRLFAASLGGAKCFDTSSGSLLNAWAIPGDRPYSSPSIALSPNQRFITVVAHSTLSFRDASTYEPIGEVITRTSRVWSLALSHNNDYVATGEENGKLTLQSLHDVLPDSYYPVDCTVSFYSLLPFTSVCNATFNSWKQSNLIRAEELLSEEIQQDSKPHDHACSLAHRALVRYRLKQQHLAIDDAKKSIEIERSVIGHIALAMAHVCESEHESATRAFDLVFADGLSTENNFLLLIKAIILFECGKYDDAISRVNDLIKVVDDRSLHAAVLGYMLLFLSGISLDKGDHDRAVELLRRTQEAPLPLPQQGSHLTIISLIFGWDFDGFVAATEQRLRECIKRLEDLGGAEMKSKNIGRAIELYSTALSLGPSNPADLLIKRSEARASLSSWEEALNDADKAIAIDPQNPRGFEQRHAALHALQRYTEAVGAYNRMQSLIHHSPDEDVYQLGQKYVSPPQLEKAIDEVVREVTKFCPLVLIDVKTGRLCDHREQAHTFKSDPRYKKLVSSMTSHLDNELILNEVERFFQYVTFSHVWEGEEPSFQQVKLVQSVWKLSSSPLNNKLREFCKVVQKDGYRYAWSDTCCIDKTISTVLNQSLKMMYKWYEASSATFVLLASVDSASAIGDLTDSPWMTRAWTAQELLAPKLIRFYDRNWRPYLEDTRPNHKESPEIMQELADAIGIPRETITSFHPDDLSIRQKLRLSSTRNATIEEDIAYSLIGIFKSDILPHYGEGYAALGHLLEEIVARSSDVTVLAWTGQSSLYNSCLPATLAVYQQLPRASSDHAHQEHGANTMLDACVEALRCSLSDSSALMDALGLHDQITELPPVRFSHRRLYLPCVVFVVKKLKIVVEREDEGGDRDSGNMGASIGNREETHYQAQVTGIGQVEFCTTDKLSPKEPGRLVFVHPWIHDLRNPYGNDTWGGDTDDEEDNDGDSDASVDEVKAKAEALPSEADRARRALRLIVRLQQPFEALLLQQQINGEFRRVATEHAIRVLGLDSQINWARDVRARVVEVL